MSRDFPDWIDVERAAQARRRFAGDIPLAWMPRVLDLLEAPEAGDAISFELAMYPDEGAVIMDVHVFGSVPMLCQRTLKRFYQPIDSRSHVAVLRSEQELAALPEDLEPKLVPEGRVALAEVVEDELLLALPLVPRDPASEPIIGAGDPLIEVEEREENPFAALEHLRKKREQN